MQAYSALLADRREALVAERTALAALDVAERKKRHTRAAHNAALELGDENLVAQYEAESIALELQPEHEALSIDLTTARKQLHAKYNGRAVKSVMADLSRIANGLTDKDHQKAQVRDWAWKLRAIVAEQGISTN